MGNSAHDGEHRPACSLRLRLELLARGARRGWTVRGDKAGEDYRPTRSTYGHNSAAMDGPGRA